MLVARVTGSMVATQKVAAMVGHKLLTVEPYQLDPQTRNTLQASGRTFVAVDPVDTVIVGIVDSVHVDQQCVYDKESK